MAIELISNIEPKNNGSFYLAKAKDILAETDENGNEVRLDEKLSELDKKVNSPDVDLSGYVKNEDLEEKLNDITISGVGIATPELLGAVKVGSGLSITNDGVLKPSPRILESINEIISFLNYNRSVGEETIFCVTKSASDTYGGEDYPFTAYFDIPSNRNITNYEVINCQSYGETEQANVSVTTHNLSGNKITVNGICETANYSICVTIKYSYYIDLNLQNQGYANGSGVSGDMPYPIAQAEYYEFTIYVDIPKKHNVIDYDIEFVVDPNDDRIASVKQSYQHSIEDNTITIKGHATVDNLIVYAYVTYRFTLKEVAFTASGTIDDENYYTTTADLNKLETEMRADMISERERALLAPFIAQGEQTEYTTEPIIASAVPDSSPAQYHGSAEIELPDSEDYTFNILDVQPSVSDRITYNYSVGDNGKILIEYDTSTRDREEVFVIVYEKTALAIDERIARVRRKLDSNSNSGTDSGTNSGSDSSTDDGWIEGSCKDEWYKSVYPSEVVISMSYPDEYEDQFYNIDNVHLKLITDYSGDQPMYYGHAIRKYRGSPPNVAEGLLAISFNPNEDDGKRVIYRFSGYRVCGSGYECGQCNETFEEFINNTNANYPILGCITMHKYKL